MKGTPRYRKLVLARPSLGRPLRLLRPLGRHLRLGHPILRPLLRLGKCAEHGVVERSFPLSSESLYDRLDVGNYIPTVMLLPQSISSCHLAILSS